MTEWRPLAIGELGTIVTGSTPPKEHPDWFGNEVDFITPTDLSTDGRRPSPARGLSTTGIENLRTRLLPPGTVCFTCIASIGKMCLTAAPAVTNQQINSVVVDVDVADARFVYYLLRNEATRIGTYASGAATPIINKSTFSAIEVELPALSAQTAIAEILGAVDDLIENNRRRIEVLEEMAQAIYREWFVHFRFPGHEHATFVDSPLGPIPEDWEIKTVAQLCSRIQAGGTPSRSESAFWVDGTVDWYKTGDLNDSLLVASSERISEYAVTSSTARTFDPQTILMAIYGSPTVGRLGLVESASSANQAALGLVADPHVTSTVHLWFALRGLRDHLNRIAQGAAQQNVSKKKVAEAQVVTPPASIVARFTETAEPPWRLSHRLVKANASLAALRDLLLPKLLTGDIDVSQLDLDVWLGAS